MHIEWMYVSVGVIGVHMCVCVWLLSLITNIKGNSDFFFALLRRAHGVVHQPTHMCIQARAQGIPANSLQVASDIINR